MTMRLGRCLLVLCAVLAWSPSARGDDTPAVSPLPETAPDPASALISIDLKDADIRDVLIALGKQVGANVVADPSLQGKVTMHLEGITFETALAALVEPYGYSVDREGTLYRIKKSEGLPSVKIEFSPEGLMTLHAQQAALKDVLQEIAQRRGLSLILRPGVEGVVTTDFANIEVIEGIRLLAANFGYLLQAENGVYTVIPPAPAAPTPPAPRIKIEVRTDSTLSLHVQEAPLREVVQELARVTGMSIILRPGLEGTASLDLEGIALVTGLRLLAANFGYELTEEAGVYVIAPPATPAPPPAPAPPAQTVTFENGFLTVDVKGLEIRDLLERVSRASGINIVSASDVKGPVDVLIRRMPLEPALETLLNTNGYTFRRGDNLYRVYKTPETQAAGGYNVACRDGKVSIDVTEADLGQLLAEIAKQSGNDLIIFGAVRDKVNIKLTEVPLDAALDLILAGTRWSAQRRDKIILLGDRSPGSSTAGLLTETRVYTLKHLKVAEVLNLLPASVPASAVKVLTEQNALAVRGTRLELAELEDYLSRIDKAPPVIMIDVLVVEFSDRTGYDQALSVQAQSADGSNELTARPGFISGTINVDTLDNLDEKFTATLELLVSEGKATVRANPRVSTLSGHEASINVGTEEYFKVTTGNVQTPLTQLEKIASGIMLTITPWSSEGADRITVKVKAEVSSPGQVNAEGLPAISTRNATTELAVRDGQTIVIGGLLEARESNTEERVPILGRIPVLGILFTTQRESARQSELVFYITPRLSRDGERGTPPPLAGTQSDTTTG